MKYIYTTNYDVTNRKHYMDPKFNNFSSKNKTKKSFEKQCILLLRLVDILILVDWAHLDARSYPNVYQKSWSKYATAEGIYRTKSQFKHAFLRAMKNGIIDSSY